MQPERFQKAIAKAVADIAWGAWNRLGVHGSGPSCTVSIDVEAAIILAAWAGWSDGRLFDGALSWLSRYHAVTSAERLKLLLRDAGDPFVTRCVGAMCESLPMGGDSGRWRSFTRKLMVSLSGNEVPPPPTPGKAARWIAPDETFRRWGLERERVVLTHKLKAHEAILSSNTLLRLRFLVGVAARADILYLLAAAEGSRRETGDLTTRRLSEILGYHASSVVRVQHDLAEGGYLKTSPTQGGSRPRWDPTPSLKRIFPETKGETVTNWRSILAALAQAMALAKDIEKTSDDLLRRHLLFDYMGSLFQAAEASLAMRAQALPAGPLEGHSFDGLAESVLTCLAQLAAALVR